jgi:hypothetical protein
MGCFDSFIVEEMTCPRCGKKIRQVDFQTKSLFNTLEAFYIGDHVPTNADRIPVLATCDECTETVKEPFQVCYTFLEGFAVLEKEIFVRLEIYRYKHDVPKKDRIVAQLKSEKEQVKP